MSTINVYGFGSIENVSEHHVKSIRDKGANRYEQGLTQIKIKKVNKRGKVEWIHKYVSEAVAQCIVDRYHADNTNPALVAMIKQNACEQNALASAIAS